MSHCHCPLRNQQEVPLAGVLVTSSFLPVFLSGISMLSQQPSPSSSPAKIQGRDPPPTGSSQGLRSTGARSASPAPPANGERQPPPACGSGPRVQTDRPRVGRAVQQSQDRRAAAPLRQHSPAPSWCLPRQHLGWLGSVPPSPPTRGQRGKREEGSDKARPRSDSAWQSDSEPLTPRGAV